MLYVINTCNNNNNNINRIRPLDDTTTADAQQLLIRTTTIDLSTCCIIEVDTETECIPLRGLRDIVGMCVGDVWDDDNDNSDVLRIFVVDVLFIIF